MFLAQSDGGNGGGAAGILIGLIGGLFAFAFGILLIASSWRLFTKAGQPGWAAIVPIYNIIVLLRIIGKPAWWIFLFFVPLVSLVVSIIVYIDLAKSFGKGTGYGIALLFFFPFMLPMLAFGDAQYVGPAGMTQGGFSGGGYASPAGYAAPGGYGPPPGGGFPQGGGYSPQGGGYPPQGGGYPPQGGGYPPQGGGYPPQGGGFGGPPQQGGGGFGGFGQS